MNAAREFFLKYSLQIVVLLLVVGIMATVSPSFRGEAALFSSLERLIPLGVIAAGLAVTMIAGEFDLSVASMAAFAGAIAVQLGGLGLIMSILIATVVGVLLGSLQGWVIARLGISSLVFTVGTLILLRGATWLATGGVPVTLTDYKLSDALMVRIWVFTPLSLTTIAVLAVLGIFLSRTRWGREISSVGGARQEAVASGSSSSRVWCSPSPFPADAAPWPGRCRPSGAGLRRRMAWQTCFFWRWRQSSSAASASPEGAEA